jgi:hypothetical protein
MRFTLEAALRQVEADEAAGQWDTDVDKFQRNQSQSFQRVLAETARLLHNEPDYYPSLNELRVLDEFAAGIFQAGKIYCRENEERDGKTSRTLLAG